MKQSDKHFILAMVYAFFTFIAVEVAIVFHPAFAGLAILWFLLFIAWLCRYAIERIKGE